MVGNLVPDVLAPNDFCRLRQAAAFCESLPGYFGPFGSGHPSDSHWRDLERRIRRALECGEIVLISEDAAFRSGERHAGGGGFSGEAEDEWQGNTTRDAATKIHWIEFRVIDVTTGNPVPGLQLEVTLADASKQKTKTNQAGSIRFDDTTPGDCTLLSSWKDVRLEDVYAFLEIE
jgi:hypothetical protein